MQHMRHRTLELLQELLSPVQVPVRLGHFIGRLPQLLSNIPVLDGDLIGPFAEFRSVFTVMLQPVSQKAVELTSRIVHRFFTLFRLFQ